MNKTIIFIIAGVAGITAATYFMFGHLITDAEYEQNIATSIKNRPYWDTEATRAVAQVQTNLVARD